MARRTLGTYYSDPPSRGGDAGLRVRDQHWISFQVDVFLPTLLNGIAVGSLYALIALGYTMVYGILTFINFAHSDVFVLGAWSSYAITAWALLHFWPDAAIPWWGGLMVLPAAMIFCGCVGFTIERLAYRPLRRAPRLNVLITAIGVSLFLQNFGQLDFMFGTRPKSMPALLPNAAPWIKLGQVDVWPVDVLGAGTAVLLMIALDWLVFHTKIGRAMRAVSFSPQNAALMGIPVDRVISITFVIGATLAAAAGFLFAQKYPGLNQPAAAIWVLLGLKAFVAAVVGGIGNIRGAMLGGVLIGLIEFFGTTYLNDRLRDVYVFSLLILVLLVRPSGILGRAAADKV
ncbi:MAG: branched-chain amino acid ABC transporter permease [Phycisphaerae bacterium]